MRYIFIFSALLWLSFFTARCVSNHEKAKNRPAYEGIDSQAAPLIAKYVELAKEFRIKFTKPLSVGFTDINEGSTVGICFYGKKFREIEIDNKEWAVSSSTTREQLIFHELSHCLCSREHDFINDKGELEDYPRVGMEEFVEALFAKWPFYLPLPGRYADGCPTSFMFPHVLYDYCSKTHREDYLAEMFFECDPW